MNLLQVLVTHGFTDSKSEARRMLAQRAVRVDGFILTADGPLSEGVHEIRIGKNIARIVEVRDEDSPDL